MAVRMSSGYWVVWRQDGVRLRQDAPGWRQENTKIASGWRQGASGWRQDGVRVASGYYGGVKMASG